MKKRLVVLMILAMAFGALPLQASNARAEFDAQIREIVGGLDREVVDRDGAVALVQLVQGEYETPTEELAWALEHEISWGHIVALAYIRATTGRTFNELHHARAHQDLWSYAENAGMNPSKMVRSLGQFLERAERARNSRIFERLRSTREISRVPDLGSGFGLFQEALDFRRIESPAPTKIHTVNPGILVKGEK